mmetsp:Transcript_4151/g.14496  ORF Transcript_4151/g.14496 Transcript_4151/m.14496 type:complete len:201 (-) Transcript_4151:38-640(-)
MLFSFSGRVSFLFCFNCPRLDLTSALPSSGFKGARASDAAFPRAQDGSIYRESPPSSPSSSPAPSSLVDWEKTAHTAPKTATRTQPRMGSLIPNGSLVPSPFSLLSTRAKAGEAVRVAAPTMAAASIFGSCFLSTVLASAKALFGLATAATLTVLGLAAHRVGVLTAAVLAFILTRRCLWGFGGALRSLSLAGVDLFRTR